MHTVNHLNPETLQLSNRVGRDMPVDVQCLTHRGRFYIILIASTQLPGNQLLKNAEHLARQLIERLRVSPNDVDFIQYQPSEEPQWLRWRFQWVGNSPLKGASYPINPSSQKSFLAPLLAEGVVHKIVRGNVAAVA